MANKRRTYTNEFKVEAVELVTQQGRSVAEAARSLGISEDLLRSWKISLQAQGDRAFPGHGRASPPSRTNSAASAPRTRGCGWSGTS